jgi:uncharacterized protein DUF6627
VKTFEKNLIRFLIVSLCYLDVPMRLAHADLIPTDSVTAASQAGSARQSVERYMEREDVRAGLEQYGVKPEAAKARVAALGDDEVAALAGKIDSQPAGGEIIGALVFVFVLLLVTDILGFTKIFPFTRSVK